MCLNYLFNGKDRDYALALFAFVELHSAIDESKESVVFALAHAKTREMFVPPLAHDNIASYYSLATEFLHSEPLRLRLTAIL